MPGIGGGDGSHTARGYAVSEEGGVRILVLCTGNSARSQIAEALLVRHGGARVAARSAGTSPSAGVHPEAIDVLARHGIEWTGGAPKGIDDVTGEYDLVITVCDNARDACPFFPGAHAQVHWGLPDPTAVGNLHERRQAFDETYDVLDRSVRNLLALPLEKLEREELSRRASEAFTGERIA